MSWIYGRLYNLVTHGKNFDNCNTIIRDCNDNLNGDSDNDNNDNLNDMLHDMEDIVEVKDYENFQQLFPIRMKCFRKITSYLFVYTKRKN